MTHNLSQITSQAINSSLAKQLQNLTEISRTIDDTFFTQRARLPFDDQAICEQFSCEIEKASASLEQVNQSRLDGAPRFEIGDIVIKYDNPTQPFIIKNFVFYEQSEFRYWGKDQDDELHVVFEGDLELVCKAPGDLADYAVWAHITWKNYAALTSEPLSLASAAMVQTSKEIESVLGSFSPDSKEDKDNLLHLLGVIMYQWGFLCRKCNINPNDAVSYNILATESALAHEKQERSDKTASIDLT